jgi:hypothetical protein
MKNTNRENAKERKREKMQGISWFLRPQRDSILFFSFFIFSRFRSFAFSRFVSSEMQTPLAA